MGSPLEDRVLEAARHRRLVRDYATALTRVGVEKGTTPSQMMGALVGNLVAIVKASAPPTEWRQAGEMLANVVRRELGEIG